MARRKAEERQAGHGELGYGIFWAWIVLRILIGLVVAVLVAGFLYSMLFGGYRPMMFGMGWAWGLLGLFFVLLFLSWVFRWPLMHGRWHMHGRRAEEILRRRYARGEITQAQFRRMMKELRRHED